VTQESLPQPEATRRTVLAGTGLAGAGLVGLTTLTTLAACSTSSSSAGSGTRSSTTASGSAPGAANPGGPQVGAAGSPTATDAGGGTGGGGGTALGAATAIPLHGGKVFKAEKVVVTQPAAGQYRAFSAVCTHLHCIVDRVANGTIDCPCHGSRYSITDGSVVGGPAPSPLPSQPITVSGGQITVG
jgi:Rieske Fe-S protein